MTDVQKYADSWLNRNYSEWQEIQKLKQRLELSESTLSNGVSRMAKPEIQENHSGNSQEEKLINFSYLSQVIAERVASLDKADALTIQVIGTLDKSDFRLILLSRYILRQSWGQMEKEMHMSRRTLFRIRDKALTEASKKIKAMI